VSNFTTEVLKIIHRNPRISPVLIHEKLKKSTNMSYLTAILRSLRESGQVRIIARGIYEITDKGVETLQSSEKTEAET